MPNASTPHPNTVLHARCSHRRTHIRWIASERSILKRRVLALEGEESFGAGRAMLPHPRRSPRVRSGHGTFVGARRRFVSVHIFLVEVLSHSTRSCLDRHIQCADSFMPVSVSLWSPSFPRCLTWCITTSTSLMKVSVASLTRTGYELGRILQWCLSRFPFRSSGTSRLVLS